MLLRFDLRMAADAAAVAVLLLLVCADVARSNTLSIHVRGVHPCSGSGDTVSAS
jgi:hypothetical protein